MTTWESNSVIYNFFNCNVNFPAWRHYLGWQCDIINLKSFHENLMYLFQILPVPLQVMVKCYELLKIETYTFTVLKHISSDSVFFKLLVHLPATAIKRYFMKPYVTIFTMLLQWVRVFISLCGFHLWVFEKPHKEIFEGL